MFFIRLNSSIKISHTVNMKDDVVNSQMCVWVFFYIHLPSCLWSDIPIKAKTITVTMTMPAMMPMSR